ncbi:MULTISPECIES: vWA domain-containing protein [Pseudofrankia]|uniref:vWA domain-containing protein n=1 Tax=Pseudofrankia TaxID=2994363 RepID=UPI0003098E8A|nr:MULTISPECIES: VWA domain-containing protein [Pseudofrankia]OHV39899.1 hypothetical protein BCD49_09940 [Pseudofrankia sp. EUN1h]
MSAVVALGVFLAVLGAVPAAAQTTATTASNGRPSPSATGTSPASAAPTTPATTSPGGSGSETVGSVGKSGSPLIHAVVLVDESNSLKPAEVDQEAQAAGLIAAEGQLDPESEIAVVGFGTDDGKAGQVAADDTCPMAPVGSTDFRSCLAKLKLRTEAEGSGTDHAAALDLALNILEDNKTDGVFNVVFLLTDGGLRVDNSPRYGSGNGSDPAVANQRIGAAKTLIDGPIKAKAQRLGVQIWPVGFGSSLDVSWMNHLATIGVGATTDCKVPPAAPAYRFAGNAEEVIFTLHQALANATCLHIDPDKHDDGGPGSPVTLTQTIPVIASRATITAVKRNKDIKVTFTDPNGKAVGGTGSVDGSEYTLNTSSPGSESLSITNPIPGTWKVTFTWPDSADPQTVASDLTWLGQLSGVIRLDPPSPKPGETAVATVRLITSRNIAVTDPGILEGLSFDARLSGEGFDPQAVTLTDDGQGGDKTAHDATFSGTVTVPGSATGGLSLIGRIQVTDESAIGLRGTVQSASYAIPGERSGGVVLQVPAITSAHRGDRITATLTADNTTGSDREIKIALDGVAGATVEPTTVTVRAGQNRFTKDLTIRIAPDAAYGERAGVLRALDATGGGQGVVLDEESLAFDVKAPPGFFAKYWYWFLIGLAVLILAVLVALLLRARWRRAADVSYLQAWASRAQGGPVADLPAPNRWAPQFRFVLRDTGQAIILTLANPDEAADVYTVRRAKHGQLTVIQPSGERRTDPANTPIPLASGLLLRIEDRRVGAGGGGVVPPAPGDPWGGGGQTPADPFSYGGADPFGSPYPGVPAQAAAGGGVPGAAGAPGGQTPPAHDPFGAAPGGQDPFGANPTYSEGADPYGGAPTYTGGAPTYTGGAPTYTGGAPTYTGGAPSYPGADPYGGNPTYTGGSTYGGAQPPPGQQEPKPGQAPPTAPQPGPTWGDEWGNDPFGN